MDQHAVKSVHGEVLVNLFEDSALILVQVVLLDFRKGLRLSPGGTIALNRFHSDDPFRDQFLKYRRTTPHIP